MSATTVKLEAELLGQIRAVKSPGQSLAGFVREAVERDLRRRQLRLAAEQYQTFLEGEPDERADVEAWERAPLGVEPRHRSGRR